MKALTSKELEYMVDSLSNEDLLIKQNAVLMASAGNAALKQASMQMIQTHQQHTQMLLQAIGQHQQLAPTQPQSH
ncbi:hypothetical protein SAMN02799624_03041 [Paenibacillus sp. UNC496MF]|uniref:hypothetical protein n=1 Tax=Paenibacillus sp. UNC496MF TaxID=1502753 RepID=UPI0008F26398|nr:hypothetical protein [Paenibacillus sp. UNC496MF]SFJ02231.1 hypothetical protein SAMN02799624_03041 [Paenibacillus sp. UNC496MF]